MNTLTLPRTTRPMDYDPWQHGQTIAQQDAARDLDAAVATADRIDHAGYTDPLLLGYLTTVYRASALHTIAE